VLRVKTVTDDSGLVQSRMEYMPFGETWFQEDASSFAGYNPPKYNSQELDRETGYYFYNARHYDPEIGRFVTPDTMVDGENTTIGWNRYAYCGNDPIRYKDPTGHLFNNTLQLKPNIQTPPRNGNGIPSKNSSTLKSFSLDKYWPKNLNVDQAKANFTYDKVKNTSSTKVNGIKFRFFNNVFSEIEVYKDTLWSNLSYAAISSNVSEIVFNRLAGDGPPHSQGRAADIRELVTRNNVTIPYKRFLRINDKNEWSWSTKTIPDTIEKFEKGFMSRPGSEILLGPWEMRYTKGYHNLIDSYPDVATVGPTQYNRTEAYNTYVDNNQLNERVAEDLWMSYMHHHHGHYQVRMDYD